MATSLLHQAMSGALSAGQLGRALRGWLGVGKPAAVSRLAGAADRNSVGAGSLGRSGNCASSRRLSGRLPEDDCLLQESVRRLRNPWAFVSTCTEPFLLLDFTALTLLQRGPCERLWSRVDAVLQKDRVLPALDALDFKFYLSIKPAGVHIRLRHAPRGRGSRSDPFCEIVVSDERRWFEWGGLLHVSPTGILEPGGDRPVGASRRSA